MRDLPSGAVSFLFTDIEGSTRLVRQLRGGYADVLNEHQRLLRAAFDQHGGHEIDTQGDAFFYVFGSAHEAVLASIEGQRALIGFPWPDGAPLKVRIGIHTGQAAPAGGRYTGLAVHRAARICSAAHGNQVLVSQATQSLLEDDEDELALRLRDLGDVSLKDMDRPVRLYQVEADGLPTEFPPPRGEAEPTDALEATIAAPVWRSRPAILAAVLVVLAVVAAALVLATRGTTGGLSVVHPNNVGLIDSKTNKIVDEIPAGRRPGPIAVDGTTAWVGNLDDRTLTRIDGKRGVPAGTFTLDNKTPDGVAAGAGSVWVAHGIRGSLSAVEPEFGRITKTIPIASGGLGSSNAAVTVDPGGNAVWAVYGDSTLARVDPRDLRPTGETTVGSAPAGVVVASGYVWVVNTDSSNVQRFSPETFEQGQIGTPTSVGERPTAIAAGAGALWVANSGDDTVTRIEAGSGGIATTTEPIPVGDAPSALAFGDDAVWVANAGDGTISRIDPHQRKVVKTIRVGNAPTGIAYGDGKVWVTVQAP